MGETLLAVRVLFVDFVDRYLGLVMWMLPQPNIIHVMS